MTDTNSKRSRVEPVFGWLELNGGPQWPCELVRLANSDDAFDPGAPEKVAWDKEITVPASPGRLAWLIENASRLAPRDGRNWREYRRRVIDNPKRADALATLASESTSIPRELRLEGPTHADCLVECSAGLLWIEGKRNDWLDTSTTWDVARDQLARNLEAASLHAGRRGLADFRLLICHEGALKWHEEQLIEGYRAGTWAGGWPHLSDHDRGYLAERVHLLTWGQIVKKWPELRQSEKLLDVAMPQDRP